MDDTTQEKVLTKEEERVATAIGTPTILPRNIQERRTVVSERASSSIWQILVGLCLIATTMFGCLVLVVVATTALADKRIDADKAAENRAVAEASAKWADETCRPLLEEDAPNAPG